MVTVITYDHPHRKTQDLIWKLLMNGYENIRVVALPYINRDNFKPIYHHRPEIKDNLSIYTLCNYLSLNLIYSTYSDLGNFLVGGDDNYNLIGGAGIIPKSVTDEYRIINSHPGFLPYTKGLDALKWAIYNGDPIGVTTHYVTDEIDNGDILLQKFVPIYFEDTFHAVAQRQYEMEIDLLVESIGKYPIKGYRKDTPVNKRMPHHIENIMIERFESIRKKSPSYINQ